MNLGAEVAAAIPELRRLAESTMVDECAITRPGGEPVYDPETDSFVDPSATLIYSGKCKVQTRNVIVNEADVGEQEVGVVRWEVHLPVDSDGYVTDPETDAPYMIGRKDVVTMTAATLDPTLVGRRLTIAGPHVGTAKTARRLPVEAVV